MELLIYMKEDYLNIEGSRYELANYKWRKRNWNLYIKMTEEFDKGDVIHQEKVILKDEDDINSIYLKLINKIPLLINKLEKYIKHPTKLKKQSEK